MLKVNSRVKTRDNREGIVLEIKDSFVKVLIDNKDSWYPIDELEDISYNLIDRLIRNDIDEPINFILAIDAYRLLTEYRFNPYVLASSTKVKIFPHQIDEVTKIIDDPRILLADEVGLGKTITTALVADELNARGIVKKMLFVVPKSLVLKWRDELKDRFELDAKIIDSSYVKVNGNPFIEKEFCYIASMDYLKQDHVLALIKEANNIDITVVDEAHKLAKDTDRYKLGKELASISTFMLLLTATPHNGDNEDYLARVRLLDPYLNDIEASRYLLIRNMKEDVIDLDGKEVFPKRESKTVEIRLSNEELAIYDMLNDYLLELEKYSYGDKREEGATRFLSTLFRKRGSSSLYALRRTLERRVEKLGSIDIITFNKGVKAIKEGEEEFDEEVYEEGEEHTIGYTPIADRDKEKRIIKEILNAIYNLDKDSKLDELLRWISKIKSIDKDAKIVIFTEYRDTLNYLKEHLSYNIVSIDGSMNIEDRKKALDEFKEEAEVMVCTDAAGEGIDMQFCNIMINYDLPWNPNRLEQRMGRIHRIGQNRNVYYYNFILDPRHTIDGYIFDKLLNKIESIKEAMKDKVYDILGRLISEDDIASIYEELLKIPKDQWEAKIKKIDDLLEERKRIVEEINRLLSGYRLDRSKLEDMKHILKHAVDHNEVKRFVRVFLELYGGKMEEIDRVNEEYMIYMPRTLAYNTTASSKGSFLNDIAMSKNMPYFALGSNMIMHMLKYAAKPSVSIFKHPYLKGLLFIFLLSIHDAKGNARDSRLLALLADDNIKEIDLKSIWDLKPIDDYQISTKVLLDNYNLAREYSNNKIDELFENTNRKISALKDRTKNAITNYYSSKISEINNRVDEYRRRLRDEPYMQGLIKKNENDKIKLKQEMDNRLRELENNYRLYKVIELIGIAEIIAEEGYDIRKQIDRAGIEKVLEYEIKRAKTKEELERIKDVSDMLVGYDIESFDRVIEVKSFKDTGKIELTSHEWATALRLKDEYWLYVVENALGEGRIYTFQNPAEKFRDKVRIETIVDYRYIIEDWKLLSNNL